MPISSCKLVHLKFKKEKKKEITFLAAGAKSKLTQLQLPQLIVLFAKPPCRVQTRERVTD